jgi:hypothetical protein
MTVENNKFIYCLFVEIKIKVFSYVQKLKVFYYCYRKRGRGIEPGFILSLRIFQSNKHYFLYYHLFS